MRKIPKKSLYVGPFRVPAYSPTLFALVVGFAGGYIYCDSQQPSIFSSPATLPKLNVCFSPDGHCEDMAVQAINSARSSIYVRAYSFTAQPIASALIAAQQRGIIVKLLVDKSQLKEKHTKIRELQASGIPVKIEKVSGIAHNKVIVIDENIILTGSYNWSKAANERNAENLLAINDPELAKVYIKDWLNAETRSYSI